MKFRGLEAQDLLFQIECVGFTSPKFRFNRCRKWGGVEVLGISKKVKILGSSCRAQTCKVSACWLERSRKWAERPWDMQVDECGVQGQLGLRVED